MIVFYNPFSTTSHKHPLPMSLLAVASMIEGERDYQIVDGNLEDDPVDRIVELGRRRKLTAVAVTVMPGPQLARAIPDSRRIKQALPEVPIIWGGYFPSQHDDVVLGAVKALGAVRARAALPALVRLLANDDPAIQAAVHEAIERIGG